jgi:phage baseplate assembly protein W|tara:strand:- start:11160 stop:11630 length:471 start_codon:yes stop_codon:yes gene_type:complete
MANGVTYGINFPFRDSRRGDYLELTQLADQQVKSDLIHLLLTRKGSRYYLPNFGTRLYEFLFEPFDGLTFDAIQSDIRDAVQTFMPNLLLNQITITPADPEEEVDSMIGENTLGTSESPIYRLPGKGTSEYTAKIRIDYSNNRSSFAQSDFVIINI